MKTLFYLVITALVSTGAIFAGLNQHTPLLGYSIGLAAWGLFFWRWHMRAKNNERRKR